MVNCVQDEAVTSRVQKERCVFAATNGLFGQIDWLPFHLTINCKKMTLLTSEKYLSRVQQLNCQFKSISKKALHRQEVHETTYRKYIACANIEYQASPWGRVGTRLSNIEYQASPRGRVGTRLSNIEYQASPRGWVGTRLSNIEYQLGLSSGAGGDKTITID